MSFGPLEIILLLVVVALVFGAKKLPELGKGLGLGIKEFRKETREPLPPPQATTPLSDVTVTDVQARPLEPATQVPVTQVAVTPTPVAAAEGRAAETAPERDPRA